MQVCWNSWLFYLTWQGRQPYFCDFVEWNLNSWLVLGCLRKDLIQSGYDKYHRQFSTISNDLDLHSRSQWHGVTKTFTMVSHVQFCIFTMFTATCCILQLLPFFSLSAVNPTPLLFVGCLMSQVCAGMSQGWICLLEHADILRQKLHTKLSPQ